MYKEKQKFCFFCKNKNQEIDYKDASQVKRYLNYAGRIQPKSKNGNCTKHQRQMTKAIKTARNMGLISADKT